MAKNFERVTMETAPPWVEEFFDWFRTPSMDRDPRTVTDFCKQWGIYRSDISSLQDSDLWAELTASRTQRGGFTSHQLAMVRDSLLTGAMTGNVKAQEIVLRMSGDFVPQEKRETVTAPVSYAHMDSATLFAELAKRAAEAAEAHAQNHPVPHPEATTNPQE